MGFCDVIAQNSKDLDTMTQEFLKAAGTEAMRAQRVSHYFLSLPATWTFPSESQANFSIYTGHLSPGQG